MIFRKPFISTLAVLCLLILNPGFAAAQDEETAPPSDTEIQSTDIPAGQEPAPPAPEDPSAAPTEEEQAKQSKQTKAAPSSTPGAMTADASGTGEVTIGSTSFLAPPTPDNSTFSGSANYKIPILTPPGRNGLAPAVALTYNSMRGNSWVGVGWDLDLGTIRRSTKRSVDYTKNDFVFSSEGKSYDLVDRTSPWGANFYGAKAEEDFTKYYRDPTTLGWIATTKDGTKYYYGSTDASRQFNGNNIFQWYLDRVEDTNGNYISITYMSYPTSDPGQLYPFEIKYTGHVSGLQPTNSIKFILDTETRTDQMLSYVPHFKTLMTKRLKSIEIRAGAEFVRRYEIAHNYSPATKRTLVQSVTEVGNDETSTLPPISFSYQDSGPIGEDSFTKLQKPRDWFSGLTASGGKTVHTTTGDQNGDGLEDIYYEAMEEAPSYIYDHGAFLVSQGNGDFNTIDTLHGVFPRPSCLDPNSTIGGCQERTLGDINGDGKMEFIERPSDSDGYQPFSSLDINGDGYTDLYFEEVRVKKFSQGGGCDDGGGGGGSPSLDYIAYPYFQLGNGDGTFKSSHISVPFPSCLGADPYSDWCQNNPERAECQPQCRTFFGDFSGDGILDIISISHPFHFASATLYFGKGDGTFDSVAITHSSLPGSVIGALDINNDGFADIELDQGYGFLLGKGDGTFESNPTQFETDAGFLRTSGGGNDKFIFGDFDGDGRKDLIGPEAIYFANTDKPYPDLLSGVTNTMGGKAFITYLPSTKYQNTHLPMPIQTVQYITTDDGLGNVFTTNYTYSGGLYDHTERDFYGFEKAVKTNPNGTQETTWFNQDYYLKGKPYKTEFNAPADQGGALLSRSTMTWDPVALSSGVTFVKLSQKRTESYDAETVFTQENYTYDDTNGNLLTTVSTGTDVNETITKASQYENKGFWTWRTNKETLTGSVSGQVRETDYTYENNTGNLFTKTAWRADLPSASPVITYQYDIYGNVLKEFDAKGNPPTEVVYETQTYTYPQYIYNPLRHWVEFEVDYRYGYAKKKIDRNNNNNTIEYFYDAFGRLVLTQNPDGGETRITYFDTAFPRYNLVEVKETGTSYIRTYGYYDGFGRSIQVSTLGEDSKSIISQTYYDNMGRAYLNEGPFFAPALTYPQTAPATGYPLVWTSYDFRGRPTTVKSKHGDYLQNDEYITTSFAYSGFNTTVTDPDGYKKLEKKDYLGRIIWVWEYAMESGAPVTLKTRYDYNAAGDLTKVTDSKGNVTNLEYDTLGRKRDMVDPDMSHWTYDYDKNGNLIKQTDAKSQVIKFEYDVLNRILTKKYYDLNDQPLPNNSSVFYIYDNATPSSANGIGKPYTVTKGNVVITNNTYDSMGRNLKVTKRIDTTDYITQNEYDLSGKVEKLTYPDNYFITYDYYPGTNLIQTITDSNNIVQAVYTDYEPTGKIGQIDYHNGTATKYTYDAWSTKLFGIVTEDPTRDPLKLLQDREYTYSRAGDILQIVDHVQKVTYDYAYDKLHRLVSEKLSGVNAPIVTKVETITLDYAGTGPVHGVKQITLNGVSRTCAYDLNGNMVTSPDFTIATNPLNRAITYDADNMPTRIVHANGKTVDFVYDGVAKRTKKLVASGKTVLYLGDHFEVENGVNLKYIFGGNLRLAQINGSLTSYFHKDHLNSTAAVTNEAGVKIEATTYEPFGSTRTQEGTPLSAYKFTDQELDNETNLYNYDARLYDPVLGMFVTPDSIVPNIFDPQSLNRYSYCRNNPLIYIDPSGHNYGPNKEGKPDWGGENGPLRDGDTCDFEDRDRFPGDKLLLERNYLLGQQAKKEWDTAPPPPSSEEMWAVVNIVTAPLAVISITKNLLQGGIQVAKNPVQTVKTTKSVINSIKSFFGKNFPTKANRGGIQQPFNPENGKYLSYEVNSFTNSTSSHFSSGFVQGLANAMTNVDMPVAVSSAQSIGQVVGQLAGNIGQLFH